MVESYELATGYISLAVSTRGLGAQIGREFAGIGQSSGQSFSEGFYRDSKGRLRDAKGKYAALPRGFGPLGEESGKRFAGGMSGALKAGLAGVGLLIGAGITKGIGDSLKAAGDLEQSVGGVQAVFGKYATGVDKASRQAAKSVGLSQNAYNELATTIGAGLKNKGIDDFAGKTQDLIGLGADLSAQFGGSAKDAVSAIGSAMRGESDPIEKYGVSLNETAVNAVLAANGQDKLKGAALDQAKAQARLSILFDQTKDAQGAFGRESDTLAGKQQRAAAQWDDLKAKIGEQFLPVATKVTGWLSEKLIPDIEDMVGGIKSGVDWFKKWDGVILPIAGSLGVVTLALGALALQQKITAAGGIIAYMKAAATGSRTWAIAQAALNLVMSLNPIGIVIIAIVALVAAIVIAYQKNEKFRKIVQAVWAGVKKAVKAVVDWFRKSVPAAVDWVKKKWSTLKESLVGAVRWVRDKVSNVLTGIQDRFRSAIERIRTIWAGLKEAAKAPIRFVINTVINDGLIGAFNKIARILPGVKELPTVSIPGFHSGGWTGPGAKMQPAGVVHADEFVINKASRRRIEQDAPGLLNRLNGYAGGGLVGGSGRFTDLFESRLLLAQRMANTQFRIFQRGFRPATSYSGTSHQGDAVDLGPVRATIVKALRQVGIAAWDRTGMGNWVPHIHGVPTPGAGSAAGSAVWQAQDYLRGGDGLGGRDSGPRVGVIGKIGAFLKAGFSSFTEWFKNLVKDPLNRLGGVTGSPFGKIAAGVPRMLVEGMVDRVASFDSGGVLKPGLTLAHNGTRRDEYVSKTPPGSGGVTINGGQFGYSPDEIAAAIEKRRRREQAMRAQRFATA